MTLALRSSDLRFPNEAVCCKAVSKFLMEPEFHPLSLE